MKAGILFSGGKDSSLAAIMVSRDYEVELNTFVFDPENRMASVSEAANALGFPFKKRVFRENFLDEVIAMILRSGYVNEAINTVHREALTVLSEIYDVVGDGTRLDDRVPMLTRSQVQSFADLSGCSYIRPLLGFSKREVQRLVERYLVVLYGETGMIRNGDYEGEIRQALQERGHCIGDLFPSAHQQSLVVARQIPGVCEESL
ncbi:MAG: alpha hydrolase [Methanospirillaceae archaeon]|nr:alpha hydrolase [Methanospirillaceae archaeon]